MIHNVFGEYTRCIYNRCIFGKLQEFDKCNKTDKQQNMMTPVTEFSYWPAEQKPPTNSTFPLRRLPQSPSMVSSLMNSNTFLFDEVKKAKDWIRNRHVWSTYWVKNLCVRVCVCACVRARQPAQSSTRAQFVIVTAPSSKLLKWVVAQHCSSKGSQFRNFDGWYITSAAARVHTGFWPSMSITRADS